MAPQKKNGVSNRDDALNFMKRIVSASNQDEVENSLEALMTSQSTREMKSSKLIFKQCGSL